MNISSSAFENGKDIPHEFSFKGENISPPLTFSDIPKNAKSLVLIMEDPDAPLATAAHWIVYNIPPEIKGFSKNAEVEFPIGKNFFRKQKYMGPYPPFGKHHYFFRLYALDTMLDFCNPPKRKQLLKAMKDHIIEEAGLMGAYKKI